MADQQKTYLVLNYNTSPVAVKTRDYNEIIPAGSDTAPTGLPMTMDEITYINSTTNVFKIGILFFEPEFEEQIYGELRIRDWRQILRNEDIYEILLHPTLERLERILEIDDQMYFDRIYGAFVGLRNTGVSISANVSNVLTARYKELSEHKRKTRIELRPKTVQAEESEDIAALREQMAAMQRKIAELTAAQDTTASSDAVLSPAVTSPIEDIPAKAEGNADVRNTPRKTEAKPKSGRGRPKKTSTETVQE